MKTYTAKFDRSKNEDVYVISNNKILKTKIVKTRIIDGIDSMVLIYPNDYKTVSGLKVEYLILGEPIPQDENSVFQSMDWIEESNIFATKEELISKID
jgi:hypothetical protein